MNYAKRILVGASALSLLSVSAFAQADRLDEAPEDEWIALSGEVAELSEDSFAIDYGYGRVTVEMGDFAWYDNNVLEPGDFVIVRGYVDDSFFEGRALRANSIYVGRLSEYIYADESESNHYLAFAISDYARDDEWVGLTGTVLEIDTEGESFVLDTGFEAISVDTSRLPYPMADEGDRVTVYGEMDDADLWEGREILASAVVTRSPG